MKKIWKDVIGFFGDYKVSNTGKVKTMKFDRNRELLQNLSPNGYCRVILSMNNNKSVVMVHWLVTEAFHGARKSGMQACHIDGNKLNNYATNLRWATAQENSLDRWKHGTMPSGETVYNAKLCNLDVWLIRNVDCMNQKIANFLGVSKHIVSRVRSGKTYTERNKMRASQ